MSSGAVPVVATAADFELKSNVYVILVMSFLMALASVWFTRIAPHGSSSAKMQSLLKGECLPGGSLPGSQGFRLSSVAELFSKFLNSLLGSGGTEVERNFKRVYVFAFLLAMLSDWLQGPYVYALYQAYGFTHAENGILFIFGFGSSMVFGTVIGGFADKYGRRKFAMLYCLIYALSCCTKHFNSFFVLSLGRILAGIATSLLYSVFESWLVCEAAQRNISDAVLGEIFSLAIFGNSVVAISAGFIAQGAADVMDFHQISSTFYMGKFCSPFDLAVLVLGICGYFLHTNWTENFGSSTVSDSEKMEKGQAAGESKSDSDSNDFSKAFELLKSEKKLQCLGLISSFFESSMFLFVFLWTPAVTANPAITEAPFGLIFSIFMLGCMIGSCLFQLLTQEREIGSGLTIFGSAPFSISQCAMLVMACSAVAHATVVISSSPFMLIVAFFLFEVAVGVYFPTMGIMKSKIVPESCRSTMYNFFRVPLNFIVCCALLINLPVKVGFLMTTAMLGSNIYLLKELSTVWSAEKGNVGAKNEETGSIIAAGGDDAAADSGI